MGNKILVLISGGGSNLQALIDKCEDGTIPGSICKVISSSSKAYGLERAAKAGIPTDVHELKSYYKGIPKEDKELRTKARTKFNLDLINLILKGYIDEKDKLEGYTKPDLIVCAGWMLILSQDFLDPLETEKLPIINLHPSLPGAFEGTHAIERSFKAGQDGEITKAGCMVHKVIQLVDRGEPLIIKEIEIVKDETLEDFEQRIHDLEHIAIVEGTVKALTELTSEAEISSKLDSLTV